MQADARAKKILFAAFKLKDGKFTSSITEAERAYAMSKGYMFDPITVTHDALLAKLAKLVTPSSATRASGAFLASLTSERLDWRCAIASHTLASRVKRHRFFGEPGCDDPTCTECTPSDWCKDCHGLERYKDASIDELSHTRHGGYFGSRGNPLFQFHDLSELARGDAPEPTREDLAMFDALLAAIDKAPAKETATKLVARLDGVIPATKSQRGALLEILGACGVLVAKKSRQGPDTDWHYVDDWRGEDGYDRKAVDRLFGMHRGKKKKARSSTIRHGKNR